MRMVKSMVSLSGCGRIRQDTCTNGIGKKLFYIYQYKNYVVIAVDTWFIFCSKGDMFIQFTPTEIIWINDLQLTGSIIRSQGVLPKSALVEEKAKNNEKYRKKSYKMVSSELIMTFPICLFHRQNLVACFQRFQESWEFHSWIVLCLWMNYAFVLYITLVAGFRWYLTFCTLSLSKRWHMITKCLLTNTDKIHISGFAICYQRNWLVLIHKFMEKSYFPACIMNILIYYYSCQRGCFLNKI